ncbi:VOC family protein [Halorarius halobius]|uniref:VOC family protein n=1 Tax=Halorarius halobius TaxID=2962671 RepID=UPI0020CCA11F|nr:VOC family protein [Halorarius halobius]
MNGRHIDHANLRIPADGREPARQFYGEGLGFGIEDARYEAGEKPFFDVRLSATGVIHLWPTESFDAPEATNFDHVCVVVEEDVESIKRRLDEADIAIDTELDSPLGATGEAGSVYVEDPFGYRIELKERV